MVSRLTFVSLVAALLSAAGPPAAWASTVDPIALRVEIYGLAGVRVLTLKSRIDEAADRYAITVDYATSGIAKMFVDIRTHAQVRGRLGAASPQPEAFRNETSRNGAERQSLVDYRPDGTVVGSSTPAPPAPVSQGAMRGTVDNLTAYYRLERQLARTGSCTLSVPVFDGRYRYDLHFTDRGSERLTPTFGNRYEGTAIICRMRRDVPAGVEGMERGEGARQGTIWYARLIPSASVMVPVRMQMETQLGTVDGYLAEIHGRGVDLKLME
jgi:hypothetical protein